MSFHDVTTGLQVSPEKVVGAHSWRVTLPLYVNVGSVEPPAVEFTAPLSPPLGPADCFERVLWADRGWDKLSDRQKDILVHNVKDRAVFTYDHFCGMLSREQISLQILKMLNRKCSLDLDTQLVKAYTGTEWCPMKQHWIRGVDPSCQPTHLCGDIFDRFDARLHRDVHSHLQARKSGGTHAGLKDVNHKVKDLIDDAYDSRPQSLRWSPCLLHPDRDHCLVNHCGAEHTIWDNTVDPLTIGTAAPPCVDASMMNSQAYGDAGRTFACGCAYLAEARQMNNAINLVECTPRWPVAQLQTAMQKHGHVTRRFILKGSALGDLYDRPRCVGLALASDLLLYSPLEDFVKEMADAPNNKFTLSSFFVATPEELKVQMEEFRSDRCCERAITDPLFWDWAEILLPSQRSRLCDYTTLHSQMVMSGKIGANAAAICDLDQNCGSGHGRLTCDGQKFPSLLRHGMHWHLRLGRPLVATELARVHSWPVTAAECEAVGSICCIQSRVVSGEFRCKDLVKCIGDGWHMKAFGTFWLWLLANVIRTSDKLPFPRCLSLKDSDDSQDTTDEPSPKRPRRSLMNSDSPESISSSGSIGPCDVF